METDSTPVRGIELDEETRCAHYHGPRDVISIRFPCCGEHYACYDCHAVCADHEAERWPVDAHDERAVRCGVCRFELTIAEYLDSDHACPACDAPFNPGCADHYGLYFGIEDEGDGEGGGFSP